MPRKSKRRRKRKNKNESLKNVLPYGRDAPIKEIIEEDAKKLTKEPVVLIVPAAPNFSKAYEEWVKEGKPSKRKKNETR